MAAPDHEHIEVPAAREFEVVGTRPIRHDGVDKVTGRAVFGPDFQTAGLLHGKILRSPHAHARIKAINTARAEAAPGVFAVVTAKDLPRQDGDRLVDLGIGPTRLEFMRDNILASDKVLYKGHAVAGVAAISPHAAEEALALIEVEYEALPSVLTVSEAMKADAPLLHDNLSASGLEEASDKPSNVASQLRFSLGDVDKGFEDADVIVEREFDTSTVHQGYIEPHNCTALWNTDGRLHIWCSTQGAFGSRTAIAWILGLPVSQIKVTPLEIGGGFGGKTALYLDPVAALLSRKVGRPVKMVMTRQEVFEGTGPTPGSHIKVKMGAAEEGVITAAQAFLAYEAGGFPGSLVAIPAMSVFDAYDVANMIVDGFDVVVNKPKTEPYRAPGATNAAFAVESVVDELAGKLRIDPIEFRLRNAAKEGTRRAHGPTHPRLGSVEVLDAMKSHPHYDAPLEGPNRGRGVAVGVSGSIGFHSSCTISVNADGSVALVEGSSDLSGSRTAVAMQAAEALGIPAEDVHPSVGDTDSVGYTFMTGGSRTTFATGWAAYEAAHDVGRQMIGRAALIWDVDADALKMDCGVFMSTTDPELRMTFKELAAQLEATGETVVGRGAVNPAGAGGSFIGDIVDVEVDPETGKVDVLRFTAVQDAGKAIHPSHVEGQIQGGTTQGIGWALNEEYFMNDDGRMANPTLLDYRMPTSLDLPMIDAVIVEVANPGHPFGVRGVGEASIVPPAGAIANAIRNAVGARLNELPMNPTAVTKAIQREKNE